MLPVISSFRLNTSIGFFSFSNAFPNAGISFPGNFGPTPYLSALHIECRLVGWAHDTRRFSNLPPSILPIRHSTRPFSLASKCGSAEHAFEALGTPHMKYCNKTFFPFTSTTRRSFSLFFSSATVIQLDSTLSFAVSSSSFFLSLASVCALAREALFPPAPFLFVPHPRRPHPSLRALVLLSSSPFLSLSLLSIFFSVVSLVLSVLLHSKLPTIITHVARRRQHRAFKDDDSCRM